ncbi:DUF6894 family protein [Sphingomonas sp.]|uniref:DUF6894 family protein n=1 Tax=Sphingomonas sp. TaxID=28214 RepID=UPI003B3BE5A3
MPRYFFDLNECGDIVEDVEGHDLSNERVARDIAIKFARSIMVAEVADGRLCLGCRILVRGEDGQLVLEVPFKDAITISGL